jgi:hypothetical protein
METRTTEKSHTGIDDNVPPELWGEFSDVTKIWWSDYMWGGGECAYSVWRLKPFSYINCYVLMRQHDLLDVWVDCLSILYPGDSIGMHRCSNLRHAIEAAIVAINLSGDRSEP